MFEKLLSKRGISLERLAALVDIQEAGSISRASGTNPVRQSLYSRQVKELARFFEVELTARKGRGLVLTPAGIRVAEAGRQALQALNDALSVCNREPIHLTIAAGESLIHWLLLEEMRSLQQSAQGVTFGLRNMRTIDIVRGLQDISLDFGLIRTDARPRNLESVPLGQLEYALFVPRSLLSEPSSETKTGKKREKKAESKSVGFRWVMANCPIAGLHGDGEFNRRLVTAASSSGIDLKFRLECDSFPSLAKAVATGGYAAVLPVLARAELPEDDVLEIHDAFFANESRPICLAWNPRVARLRADSPRLIETMARTFRFPNSRKKTA